MIDIDKNIDKKLNLIVDRYLKLNIPFKDIEKYLTGKNIDKIINELSELEIKYFNKHKDDNKKDFKKIIKNKIKDILKDRKYNYMDSSESLKYLKLFDNINWEFEDEEIDNKLEFPINLKELSHKEYKELLKILKIGDKFLFKFNKSTLDLQKDSFTQSIGKIVDIIDRTSKIDDGVITIEFDKNIDGHGGGLGTRNGNCWNFNRIHYNNLIIIKKI